MLDFLKENNECFGLDIGSSSVRIVQLKKAFGKYELVSFGSAEIPENLALSDSKLDQEAVGNIIKELVHSLHIVIKKVVTGLPGNAIFTTVVKLPKMPLPEIQKAVKYQAEQNIPLKLNEVRIDWQLISESSDGKFINVLIIAAPLSRVEKMMHVTEAAGLEINALEINAIATARALQTSEPLYMILNLGSTLTEIIVVENGVMSHTRAIPIGGQALTRAIAISLGIDQNQAEQFKQKFGLLPDKLEGQLVKACKPILTNLTEEINRSLKFYYDQYGKNITLLKLTGGSTRLLGLQDYLSESLGLGVIYGNPWAMVAHRSEITDQLNRNAFDFACGIGFAMREL